MGLKTRIESLFGLSKMRDVEVVDCVWSVTWDARYGKYYNDKGVQVKVFVNKQDAIDFAETLRACQKTLCYSEDINITIDKR